jgi:replication factor C subunit 1
MPPVDIRNFFGSKQAAPAKKATATTTATSAVGTRASATASAEEENQSDPPKTKRKSTILLTNSSTTTKQPEQVQKKKQPEKTKTPPKVASSSSSPPSSRTQKRPSIELEADAAASASPVLKKTKSTLDLTAWNQLEASITPGCLQDITFVFTGILESISRDRITEFIKIAGGRVTTAVSSKTNYVVLGTVLEDGRPVQEGKKYLRAIELAPTKGVQILHNDHELYQFIQKQSATTAAAAASQKPSTSSTTTNTTTTATVSTVPVQNPYARKTNQTNPATRNPYAAKNNTNNPYAKKATTTNDDLKPPAKVTASHNPVCASSSLLWVDKYKPQHSREILGNQDAVRKLAIWLQTWEDTFLHRRKHPNSKKPSYAAPNGPWKAALLSGPPGIGSK